jgi:hypothetical protein
MANGKEFFLKRWMRSLVEWLDGQLFSMAAPAEKPTFKLIAQVFTVTFFVGLVIGVCSLFTNGEVGPFISILGVGLSIAVLVFYVLFLLNDVKRFEKTGHKVWRGIYLFVLCSITGSVAAFLAASAIFVAVAFLVLYIVFAMLFGSDSGSGKRYRLDNGDEVKEERGLLGETYYTGSSGKSYDKNFDGTFSEK